MWDVLYGLAVSDRLELVSPTPPILPESWYAWQRPLYNYGPYRFVSGGPLFTHQYSHAWVDFRNRRDRSFVAFFQNSINATRANNLYCMNLNESFPLSFCPGVWRTTASR